MKDHASRDDHQRTLAWLDESLKWARPGDRTRLVKLLNLVRAEVLFDLDFAEIRSTHGYPLAGRGRAFGANRGT